jgi:hypothetical protein
VRYHTLRIHSAYTPHTLGPTAPCACRIYGVATLGESPYDLHVKEPGSFQPEQCEEHCEDPQVRDAEPEAGRLCISLSEGGPSYAGLSLARSLARTVAYGTVCLLVWTSVLFERSKSIANFKGPETGDAMRFRQNSFTKTTCMCCHSKPLSVCAMSLRQHPRHTTLWLERALAATP